MVIIDSSSFHIIFIFHSHTELINPLHTVFLFCHNIGYCLLHCDMITFDELFFLVVIILSSFGNFQYRLQHVSILKFKVLPKRELIMVYNFYASKGKKGLWCCNIFSVENLRINLIFFF